MKEPMLEYLLKEENIEVKKILIDVCQKCRTNYLITR